MKSDIKPMSLREAAERGFTVFHSAGHAYLPVALPQEFNNGGEAGYNLLLNQWEGIFIDEDSENKGEGYCMQTIQDSNGELGLSGQRYLVRAYYSEAGGVEDWTFYGLIEIK